MSIQMPAAEVHALGSRLVQSAGEAEEVEARLTRSAEVGNHLQSAVESFLDCHSAAARAMAGELRWLGSTIATVADSWLELDGSLLAGPGSGGSA